MKTNRQFSLLLLAVLSLQLVSATFSQSQTPAAPPRDIAGLRLNMPEGEAVEQLKKLGKLERQEGRKGKVEQVWAVNDTRFSHIIIGLDKEDKVRYVTAVAAPNAKNPMRYADISDLGQAQQLGDVKNNNYHYVWNLAAQDNYPRYQLVARGRNAEYLETFSLKRLN